MVTSLTASAAAVADWGGESVRQVTRRPSTAVQPPVGAIQRPESLSDGLTVVPSPAIIPTEPQENTLSRNADAQASDIQPAVQSTPSAVISPSTAGPATGAVAEPTAEPRGEAPIGLRIPSIGVDAGVQWVGVDETGAMQVPSNYTDVAWYELGPRPGERGNAVINGHLDSTTGPAVFWDLITLQPGDEIIVRTHGDQELRFIVTGLESYRTEEAPLDRIFGPTDSRNLNLITCDGTFEQDVRQYDRRLVVYTVLAEGQTVQPAG